MNQFLAVTAELEHALSDLPYNLLDISDEVREQASGGEFCLILVKSSHFKVQFCELTLLQVG